LEKGGGASCTFLWVKKVALVPLKAFSLERSCNAAGAARAKSVSDVARDESANVRGYACTRAFTSSLCSGRCNSENLLTCLRVSYNVFNLTFLCASYSCFIFACRIVMPYRTFFCYANSTQEAEEWIKILQWKLVGVASIHLSHIFRTLFYNSLPETVTGF